MNYKDKIRKLLALSKSSNENEAKAALLKARALMAEHKITEQEVFSECRSTIVRKTTKYSCSNRRDPWMSILANVIASHYCCRSYGAVEAGAQTRTIGFIGLPDDFDLCVMVFEYAVDSVRSAFKRFKKEFSMLSTKELRKIENGYAFGFIAGLNEALKKQDEEYQDYALVLVTPREVEKEIEGMKVKQHNLNGRISTAKYNEGVEDGRNFRPDRRISPTV